MKNILYRASAFKNLCRTYGTLGVWLFPFSTILTLLSELKSAVRHGSMVEIYSSQYAQSSGGATENSTIFKCGSPDIFGKRILRIAIGLICFFIMPELLIAQNDSLYIPETKVQGINTLPSNVLPVQACWFWSDDVFEPEGYKTYIDSISVHSPYNLISASVRLFGRETLSGAVHGQMKKATEYAASKGISMVADLDVRTARRAFESKYPNELQEMLILKEIALYKGKSADVSIFSKDLTDHYTGRTTHYIPLSGRLLRVYSYDTKEKKIDPLSLKDITDNCVVINSCSDSVCVRLPAAEKDKNVCVMVSFTHLYPDVFSPHLIEFQHEIVQRYADVPLAGVFKDEWGFPPCFDRGALGNQFWYSQFRAKAYAERTGGRDLLADCLLMYKGIDGKERERLRAINIFMEMSRQRNAEIEAGFYRSVKEVFGKDAAVTTHPTWYPYPDWHEYKKNGLDWWQVKRDWAQGIHNLRLEPGAIIRQIGKALSTYGFYKKMQKRKLYLIALFIVALTGCNSVLNKKLVLVNNKKSDYVIFVSKDAIASEKTAARMLQENLYKIAGCKIPITNSKQVSEKVIYLGFKEAPSGFKVGLDTNSFEKGEYVIRTYKNQLFIAGGEPRGTLYGVIGFLSGQLGCRWYTPDFSKIPEQNTIALTVLDIREKPVFEYREAWFNEAYKPMWAAYNRLNPNLVAMPDSLGGGYKMYPFVHTFYQLVPPEKYMETPLSIIRWWMASGLQTLTKGSCASPIPMCLKLPPNRFLNG